MAEPNETPVAEQNGKNPGTDPAVTEAADLGAAVGVGEDFDQVEEPEGEPEAKPEPPDPTKNMSPMEARDYWMKRAHHFEGEYKGERSKRQAYDKQYGGLANQGMARNGEQSRGDRAIDRFTDLQVPDGLTDLKSYTNWVLNEAKNNFKRELSEERLNDLMSSTEKAARETHNGEDGMPAYDELIDEFVVPLIQKKPIVFNLLRQMEDPAEAAYTLGFMLKFKNHGDIIRANTREELAKAINNTAKNAATLKGKNNGRAPSGKLSKAEIDAMSPEDFERELERFRASE